MSEFHNLTFPVRLCCTSVHMRRLECKTALDLSIFLDPRKDIPNQRPIVCHNQNSFPIRRKASSVTIIATYGPAEQLGPQRHFGSLRTRDSIPLVSVKLGLLF